MDFFSGYLSRKYTENSLESTDHYRTIIIQKIVRMFHTLEMLMNESHDGVSVRCVLRGILDNVATYCFIYQRDDENEVMFRHYLYALDGFRTYKRNVVDGIVEKGDDGQQCENICNEIIRKLEYKLVSHPYSKLGNINVEKIIHNANWRYESLQKPRSLKYGMIYKQMGFNSNMANYYQKYLPQFTHGLCISNFPVNDMKQITAVLYESIPLADKFIQAIHETFHEKEMIMHFRCSKNIREFIDSKDFKHEDLAGFARALIRKDKTLLI